jgi:lipid A 3-O-deacylase
VRLIVLPPLSKPQLGLLLGLLLSSCSSSRGLHLENDMGDLKKDYNHGTEVSWSKPLASADFVATAMADSGLARALAVEGDLSVVTYHIGQYFYTPEDIATPVLQVEDRPFGAWLSAGIDIETLDLDPVDMDRRDKYSSVGLSLGTVGPSALGEQVHTDWHQAFSLTEPRGWQHQLKDEPTVQARVDRAWRVDFRQVSGPASKRPWQTDADLTCGLSLGNVRTEARVGSRLRLGQNLDRSFGAQSLAGLHRATGAVEWELFAAGETRLVGRDIFLDGNTFKSSHSVNKHPVVADIGAGITARIGGVSISLGHYLRTREFDTQDEPMTIWTLDIRSL